MPACPLIARALPLPSSAGHQRRQAAGQEPGPAVRHAQGHGVHREHGLQVLRFWCCVLTMLWSGSREAGAAGVIPLLAQLPNCKCCTSRSVRDGGGAWEWFDYTLRPLFEQGLHQETPDSGLCQHRMLNRSRVQASITSGRNGNERVGVMRVHLRGTSMARVSEGGLCV